MNFVKNSAFSLIMNFSQRISGFILNIFLANALATKTFGLYALVQRFSETSSNFFRFGGFETSTQIRTAQEEKDIQSKIFLSALCFRLSICIPLGILFILFPDFIASEIFFQPTIKRYIPLIGIYAVANSLYKLLESFLMGKNKFNTVSKINVSSSIIFLFVIVLFAYKFSLVGALVAMTLQQIYLLILFGIQAIFLLKRNGLSNIQFPIFTSQELKNHLKLSLPGYIPLLISIPVTVFLLNMIITFEDTDGLANLRIIQTLSIFVQAMPFAILPVFQTYFSKTFKQNNELSSKFLMINFKIIFLVGCILGLLSDSIMPLIIGYGFGGDYVQVISYFSIFLIVCLFHNQFNLLQSSIISAGKVKPSVFITLLRFIIFFLGGLFLIPKLGLLGYFFAELVSVLISLIIAVQVITKSIFYIRIRELLFALLYLMSIFLIGVTLFIFILPIGERVIIGVLLSFILILISWYRLFSPDEKDQMILVFKNLKKNLTQQ